ncbi:unnamed protein product, partial [Callosobruchus maculatus]
MRLRCRCGSKDIDGGSKQPHRDRTTPQRRR